jgi:hypothetical protein
MGFMKEGVMPKRSAFPIMTANSMMSGSLMAHYGNLLLFAFVVVYAAPSLSHTHAHTRTHIKQHRSLSQHHRGPGQHAANHVVGAPRIALWLHRCVRANRAGPRQQRARPADHGDVRQGDRAVCAQHAHAPVDEVVDIWPRMLRKYVLLLRVCCWFFCRRFYVL